jgi:hypothetical protein
MGKMIEHPRHRVVSFRVTDEEHAAICEAKQAGLTSANMRNLVLYGARCLSADPPLPLATLALPSSDHPSGGR